MLFSLVLSVLLTLSTAQTCNDPSGTGPCINGKCAVASEKCVTSSQVCCAAADYVECVDQVNSKTGVAECESMKAYCDNAVYKKMMTEQCPKTCGFCKPVCADKPNPTTGVNECPIRKAYCINAAYKQIMTDECPKTCGFC